MSVWCRNNSRRTVTSELNAPNQYPGRINEKMTPEQRGLGCHNSQRVWEGG